VAAALLANRTQKAWVVHGSDGVDELSISGPTFVAQIANGDLRSFEVTPEDAGLQRSRLDDILGGDPQHNAQRLRALLDGETGAYRDIVLLNSAAAFIVADRVSDLKAGATLAAEMIDSGKARSTLERLVTLSNG